MESNNRDNQRPLPQQPKFGLGKQQKDKKNHVPFRGSKLTLTLRDSFINPNSCVFMIACVSPGHKSVDHSINTLRYADRLLEKKNNKIDPSLAVYLDSGKPGHHPQSQSQIQLKTKTEAFVSPKFAQESTNPMLSPRKGTESSLISKPANFDARKYS